MSTEPDKVETIIELEVPVGYQENERLDVFLTRFIPNVSRSKVQQGIRDGSVSVDGTVIARPSRTVQARERIRCRVMKSPPIRAEPEDIPLDIVFEDEHLIVVNKPAGMVVHPAYGNRTGTLVNALLHHVGGAPVSFDDNDDDGEPEDEEVGLSVVNAAPVAPADISIRPGIVHRLDKDTSGLLVVAKTDVIHRELARQFFERTIERRYLALVRGEPRPSSGTIDTHLARDPRDRKRMAVSGTERGKHAITHYKVLEPFDVASLVEFRLETGRTHQIRVHSTHIGHPILADTTYGGDRLIGSNLAQARLKRVLACLTTQALHAASLGFRHPVTERDIYFESPLSPALEAALAELRRENTT